MLLIQEQSSNFYLRKQEEELLLQLHEKGEEIPLLDLGVWQVYRGVVQISKISHDGREIVLGWVTCDSVFGNWIDNTIAYRAVALSDVYLRWYREADIKKSPLLARQLIAQFSDRLIETEQLLAIAGLRRIEDRLWQLLLMLKRKMGQTVVDGSRLSVRFTHQQLANAISTTRVTVTRILGDFQNRGWIIVDGDRHIIIKD